MNAKRVCGVIPTHLELLAVFTNCKGGSANRELGSPLLVNQSYRKDTNPLTGSHVSGTAHTAISHAHPGLRIGHCGPMEDSQSCHCDAQDTGTS